MSAPHTHDEVEARLLSILGMVNDWLKFAETKNAGLVGLGSAGAAVLSSFIGSADDRTLKIGLSIGAILVSLSVLAGLLSFFPRTSLARGLTREAGKPGEGDNLYFYGHLAKYTPAGLVEAIARDYAREDYTEVVHLRSRQDLAAQIIINSKITLDKLHLFALAAGLFGLGAVVALGTVLLSVVT